MYFIRCTFNPLLISIILPDMSLRNRIDNDVILIICVVHVRKMRDLRPNSRC